jgi:ribosomal-protein-alanine N-acetyltransferase
LWVLKGGLPGVIEVEDSGTSTPDMASLEIRPMLEQDLDAVRDIEARCFKFPWPRRSFLAELSSPHSLLVVAELEGSIVGFGGMRCVASEVHVTTLGVEPALRGRGIGRRLLSSLLWEGLRRGGKEAVLEVRMSNESARSLYASMGFAPVGLRRNYYAEEGEHAIIMYCPDLAAACEASVAEGEVGKTAGGRAGAFKATERRSKSESKREHGSRGSRPLA